MELDTSRPPAAGEESLRIRVPAKINPFLAVRSLREDGLHEVASVLQTVSLHDRLLGEVHGPPTTRNHPAARQLMKVAFEHDAGQGIPAGGENLIVRAAEQLLDRLGRRDPAGRLGVPVTRLRLRKRIPVGAGMGGGSADAAGALVLLNRLWGLDLDHDELRRLGAALGADIPFCIAGGTALATGTGTELAPVMCRGSFHWVACIDGRPLSTAAVYRVWDEIGAPTGAAPDAVSQALGSGDPSALGEVLHNDLEVATLHLRPDLAGLRDRLRAAGALGVVVSGSGPTVLALAESEVHARSLAGEAEGLTGRVEVVRSPAGGPEMVRQDGG